MTNIDHVQGVPPATGVYAIADRLTQAIGVLCDFDASGPWRCLFRTGLPDAALASD